MKLELKHLAPYLPYGLTYQVKLKEIKLMVISTGNIYNILRAVNEGVYGDEYKPILRPLSDLTKVLQWDDGQYMMTDYDDFDLDETSYNTIQGYLARHFDVFGLIEKGLAININTLK